MSKKKPRSRDPHSWIKDTTKKPAAEAAEEAPAAAADEETDESGPRRFVVVEFYKNDGRIHAAHEIHPDAQASTDEPPASSSEDTAAARIALTGDLSDKSLLEIYKSHKVDVSKKKPTLVPKG